MLVLAALFIPSLFLSYSILRGTLLLFFLIMSTIINSIHKKKNASKLALLEAKREAKRRQVEALFEQQQAIQTQMAALQKELEGLDDEIESYEYSQNA